MRIKLALGEEQVVIPTSSPPAGSPSQTHELLQLLNAHAISGGQVQGTAASHQNGGGATQTATHMTCR